MCTGSSPSSHFVIGAAISTVENISIANSIILTAFFIFLSPFLLLAQHFFNVPLGRKHGQAGPPNA
jgi:hypothetical protein